MQRPVVPAGQIFAHHRRSLPAEFRSQGQGMTDTPGPAPRRHVIISGTGRSGTTFLVQLLTRLGLDTGFASEESGQGQFFADARAGLETDVRRDDAPYVVKSPYFCEYADEVLRRRDIAIEHVLVPIRDLESAAESRRYVVRTARSQMSLVDRIKDWLEPREIPGGLWSTRSARRGDQEEVLLNHVYELMLALSGHATPVTLLRYPKLVCDKAYCYAKLRPILGSIEFDDFARAFDATARPDLVHSFAANDA